MESHGISDRFFSRKNPSENLLFIYGEFRTANPLRLPRFFPPKYQTLSSAATHLRNHQRFHRPPPPPPPSTDNHHSCYRFHFCLDMEMPEHRRWMYRRLLPGRVGYTPEFLKGLEEFDEFAKKQLVYLKEQKYRCPCVKCKNCKYKSSDEVQLDLLRKGFIPGYWYWTCHGEVEPLTCSGNVEAGSSSMMQVDDYGSRVKHNQTMVEDVINGEKDLVTSELPNANAQSLHMLESLERPLWEGCSSSHTELSSALRSMSIKCDTKDSSVIQTQDQLSASNNKTSRRNMHGLGVLGVKCKRPSLEHGRSAHTENQRSTLIFEQLQEEIERQNKEIARLKQANLAIENTIQRVLEKIDKFTKKMKKKKMKKKNNSESSSKLK